MEAVSVVELELENLENPHCRINFKVEGFPPAAVIDAEKQIVMALMKKFGMTMKEKRSTVLKMPKSNEARL